jgi:hypothetical protein
MTDNPDEGKLDPDTQAGLDEFLMGHRVDADEVDNAGEYRDRHIDREERRMRASGAGDEEVAAMRADLMDLVKYPYGYWIELMHEQPDDDE